MVEDGAGHTWMWNESAIRKSAALGEIADIKTLSWLPRGVRFLLHFPITPSRKVEGANQRVDQRTAPLSLSTEGQTGTTCWGVVSTQCNKSMDGPETSCLQQHMAAMSWRFTLRHPGRLSAANSDDPWLWNVDTQE